jgi:hypothetical protein
MGNSISEQAIFGKCPKCGGPLIFSLTWTIAPDSVQKRCSAVSGSVLCIRCIFTLDVLPVGKDFTLSGLSQASLADIASSLYNFFAAAIQKENVKIFGERV